METSASEESGETTTQSSSTSSSNKGAVIYSMEVGTEGQRDSADAVLRIKEHFINRNTPVIEEYDFLSNRWAADSCENLVISLREVPHYIHTHIFICIVYQLTSVRAVYRVCNLSSKVLTYFFFLMHPGT